MSGLIYPQSKDVFLRINSVLNQRLKLEAMSHFKYHPFNIYIISERQTTASINPVPAALH